MQATSAPPEEFLMQLGSGYWASQVLSVAVRLNLLEKLASGARPGAEMAAEEGYHAESVVRLLRGCASLGLVTEVNPGSFGLTPLGERLLSTHPQSLRDAAIMLTDPAHWNSWAQLEHTVRTGQPAYKRALGVENVFDYFKTHEAESERFNRAMASMTRAFVDVLLPAYDVSRFSVIADVGGGHGQFLGALLRGAANSRGILYDLPAVLAGADQELEALGVSQRVEKIPGSFFESVPGGADLYLLKHILHDWTDEQCAQILGHLARAMGPSAHLLIAEMILPEPPATAPAAMMDLNMMVMTGGRERTVSQYAAMLQQVGLKLNRHISLPGPYQLVEAVKCT